MPVVACTFFVQGTVAPEKLAPVCQVNRLNPLPAMLDPTLAAAAKLLSSIAGLVVFDYGPSLGHRG